jgi:hypothetical protein
VIEKVAIVITLLLLLMYLLEDGIYNRQQDWHLLVSLMRAANKKDRSGSSGHEKNTMEQYFKHQKRR